MEFKLPDDGKYLPADFRALHTLHELQFPYAKTTLLTERKSVKDIIIPITQHFPSGIAYNTELYLRMYMMNNPNVPILKLADIAGEYAYDLLLESITKELSPSVTGKNYYTREDILKWFDNNPNVTKYFTRPEDEIITVVINYGEKQKTRSITLSRDQMMGIVYGLAGMGDDRVQITSSVTHRKIELESLAKRVPIYYQPIELATEKLKRPYTVDIIKADKTFHTLHFSNPEFMQGVLSVAQWYGLQNNGKDILWKNLTQFTKEGIISLEF